MIVDGDEEEEDQVSSSISPRSGIRVVVDNDNDKAINVINNNPNNSLLCRVCHSNQAKYTCPKCQLRYCSIDCYRNHTSTSAVSDDNEETNNNIPLCSETFFRDRVNQVLKLESKEQKQRTHQVLQRHYDDEKKNNHHHLAMNDNDDHDNYDNLRSSNGITEEELLNLLMKLEALETNDNDNDTQEQQRQQQQRQQMDISQLQKLLSPAMRAQFEHDIMTMTTMNDDKEDTAASKEQQQLDDHHLPLSSSSFSSSSFRKLVLKSVVQPWYPWWRPQIVPIQESNNIDQDDAENTQAETETEIESTPPVTSTTTTMRSNDSTTDTTTELSSSSSLLLLDERLLMVPNFANLVHNNKQQDPLKSFDNHVLLYNLLEIVYITCWMLRLYNGTSNILLLSMTNTDDKNSPNGNTKNGSEIAMEVMTCIMAVSTVLQTPPTTTTNKDNVHQRQRTTTPFVSLSDVLSSCVKTSTTAMKHQQKQKQRQPRRTTDTMANTSTITDNSNDDDLNYYYDDDVIVGCNTPWNVLIEDVMLLVASHRMIGRILLELSDVLKSAIHHLKNIIQVTQSDDKITELDMMTNNNHSHHLTPTPPPPEQTLKELRLIRKKVEFYLSWSQQRNLNMLGPELQHDIMT